MLYACDATSPLGAVVLVLPKSSFSKSSLSFQILHLRRFILESLSPSYADEGKSLDGRNRTKYIFISPSHTPKMQNISKNALDERLKASRTILTIFHTRFRKILTLCNYRQIPFLREELNHKKFVLLELQHEAKQQQIRKDNYPRKD